MEQELTEIFYRLITQQTDLYYMDAQRLAEELAHRATLWTDWNDNK